MPQIERLAHVGLHVFDLGLEAEFYRDVVGLQITDGDVPSGFVFLSSRPEVEHHELLLASGRTASTDTRWLQQISFRVPTYEDVISYHQRFAEIDVPLDMTVSHGNAIGIYFFDPEGNRVEVYWPTGLVAKQGFIQHLDLSRPKDEIMASVRSFVDRYGATGYADDALNAKLDIG